jgi:hypothetical protein
MYPDGPAYTTPTWGGQAITVTIPAEMQGATFNSATLTYTVSSPSGTWYVRYNGESVSVGNANLLERLIAGGKLDLYFSYKATGGTGGEGSHSASCTWTNISIAVDYTPAAGITNTVTVANAGTAVYLVIDEDEAAIVRKIYDLLINHGYGTNRVAKYLNEHGIKTKRGIYIWRGTAIRAMIANPIYTGRYHMQGVESEPFDHLKIIEQDMFDKCLQMVKGRSTRNYGSETITPVRNDTGSLLSGVLYCGHCGSKRCYNHHHDVRHFKTTTNEYEREEYRCYRKIASRDACAGQSTYQAGPLHEAVEGQVMQFLSKLQSVPREKLLSLAGAKNEDSFKVAYKQAEKEFENARKQVTALEEEAVKALTGESQLDLAIVNQMLIKHRARLEKAQHTMDEARSRLESEKESAKETKAQIDEFLSWADCYKTAERDVRHMIISRLIERVEISKGYKMNIKFRISLNQFLGQEA